MPLGILILLTACQDQPSLTARVIDDSLITQDPCAAPCWQGLTIELSTVEEVSNFINSNPLIAENAGERRFVSSGGSYQMWWWAGDAQDSTEGNVFDYTTQGVLDRIVLHPNTAISVSEVIGLYGLPRLIVMDEVIVTRFPLEHSIGVEVDAIYLDPPLIITWIEDMGTNTLSTPRSVCLSSDSQITTVEYTTLERAEMLTNLREQDMVLQPNAIFAGSTVFQINNGETKINCVTFDLSPN